MKLMKLFHYGYISIMILLGLLIFQLAQCSTTKAHISINEKLKEQIVEDEKYKNNLKEYASHCKFIKSTTEMLNNIEVYQGSKISIDVKPFKIVEYDKGMAILAFDMSHNPILLQSVDNKTFEQTRMDSTIRVYGVCNTKLDDEKSVNLYFNKSTIPSIIIHYQDK